MRILQISEDPGILGGIPRYTVPVAARLAERGHEVHYMSSGGYSGRYDATIRRRWRTYDEDGVRYHNLINAESVGVHAGYPELDVQNGDVDWIARRARELRPDAIHVHTLLGIPTGVFKQLSEVAPTVLSVHDYALMCQRRTLVQRAQVLCRTYPSQVDCPHCVDALNPRKYRLRARLENTPGKVGIRAAHAAERITGREVQVEAAAESNGDRGQTSAQGLEAFQERLRANVQTCNEHVARVLAVSTHVRDIVVEVGVRPDLVDVMLIGSTSAERFSPLPLPSANGQPVTFMFLGGMIPFKGAHVFAEALARMDRPPRAVVVGAGSGYREYEDRVRRAAPAQVEFRPSYAPHEQESVLAGADVVVAPAVGPDPGPQVVLEALAAGRPVIGSRAGGIPDFIQEGVNGRTFVSEDSDDLARVIAETDDRDHIAQLAANARVPKLVTDHVTELEQLYAELAA